MRGEGRDDQTLIPTLSLERRGRTQAKSGVHAATLSASSPSSMLAALVLVEKQRGAEVVAWACARAEAAGVRAGMSVAQARSLLRGRSVVVQPFTPEEDARKLRQLARWALRFSPIAAPDEPDGLLLDVAGCAHLFGGEVRLAECVIDALQSLGLQARVALAPTFACAWAVARFDGRRIAVVADGEEREAIAPLPVTALRADAVTCAALAEVGVERVGQLLDVPRAELVARFGSVLLGRLDEALGCGGSTAIEAVRPLEPVEVSRVFDGPVTCWEAVRATSQELLSLLVRRLAHEQRGVCVLTFTYRRIDAPPLAMTLRLTHPSHDEAHLWTLLRPRIERLHLGYGIEEVSLRAGRTQRMEHEQIELWPDGLWEGVSGNPPVSPLGKGGGGPLPRPASRQAARLRGQSSRPGRFVGRGSDWPVGSDRGSDWFIGGGCGSDGSGGRGSVCRVAGPVCTAAWGRLLDEFIDRLGADSVSIVTPLETYVPERAFELQAWTGTRDIGVEQGRARRSRVTTGAARRRDEHPVGGGYAVARPTRLFARPEPAQAMTVTPDGPVMWIRWRGMDRPVRRCRGPERIVFPWWVDGRGENEGTKTQRYGDAMGDGCVMRDYYMIEDDCGEWLWVFRDGANGSWFVHGEWS